MSKFHRLKMRNISSAFRRKHKAAFDKIDDICALDKQFFERFRTRKQRLRRAYPAEIEVIDRNPPPGHQLYIHVVKVELGVRQRIYMQMVAGLDCDVATDEEVQKMVDEHGQGNCCLGMVLDYDPPPDLEKIQEKYSAKGARGIISNENETAMKKADREFFEKNPGRKIYARLELPGEWDNVPDKPSDVDGMIRFVLVREEMEGLRVRRPFWIQHTELSTKMIETMPEYMMRFMWENEEKLKGFVTADEFLRLFDEWDRNK